VRLVVVVGDFCWFGDLFCYWSGIGYYYYVVVVVVVCGYVWWLVGLVWCDVDDFW